MNVNIKKGQLCIGADGASSICVKTLKGFNIIDVIRKGDAVIIVDDKVTQRAHEFLVIHNGLPRRLEFSHHAYANMRDYVTFVTS